MRWIIMLMAALAASPSGARAERLTDAAPLFAAPPVADAVLAQARGGQGLFAALTLSSAARLADAQARADFRQGGGIGRITMDIWWGETGASLIAAGTRNARSP